MINIFDVKNHFLSRKKKYLQVIEKVLSSGKYILGENVFKLEEKLRKFVGSKYCISTSNGTDALEISLRAIELKKNDEVIVPSFTWISTASSVKLVGAKPVFCDIELNTYGLDYNCVKKLVNKKTKAIIIVSLYGQISKDIFKILRLCQKKKITLIEDAAQSFGASLNNYKSCNIANISTTSFFPTKSLGTYGDAGAIFTNSSKLHKKIRLIRQNGTLDKKNFITLGRNARMDEIQAALLLEKLKDFKKILKIKRDTAKLYQKKLKNYFTFYSLKKNSPSYSLFTIRHKSRDKVFSYLKRKNINPGIYYKQSLHNLKFLNSKKINLENTEKATNEVLSIPIHENLTHYQKSKIINTIIQFLKKSQKSIT